MPQHLLKRVSLLLLGMLSAHTGAASLATGAAVSAPASAGIVDAAGRSVSREQLLQTLAAADIVLLGEIHDQASHHQAEQWLLANLHALRPQRALALEMVGSDRQNRLDNVGRWYAAGNRARPERLRELLDWDPAGTGLPMGHCWNRPCKRKSRCMRPMSPTASFLPCGSIRTACRKRQDSA